MSIGLDRLKAEDRAMDRLMSKHAGFGAADTEPDGVYQWLICKQIERVQAGDGKSVAVPRNIDGWQLYREKGAGVVAKELGKQCSKVCSAIRFAISNGEWAEVCAWARDKCWRVVVSWVD